MRDAVAIIVHGRLLNEWEQTPISWPNTRPLTDSNTPWIRVTIQYGSERKTSIGNDVHHYRMDGWIVAQIFTPSGSGDGVGRRLQDDFAGLFRDFSSGILRQDGDIEARDIGPDGVWYQHKVVVPFMAESTL